MVGSMREKIIKVCTAFGVNMYPWPASPEQAKQKDAVLRKSLQDKQHALRSFQDIMRAEIADLVAPSSGNPKGNAKIEDWRLFCIKEKSIYNVLNHCEEGMALRVNVWYPESDEGKIQALLKAAREGDQQGQGAFLNPDKGAWKSTPPTYIRTNEYTEAFQEVIDTYGIPRYQEANPALITVVTFPFIFGMMYGDVGHGTLLTLAGVYLVRNAESFRHTQPVLFGARFLVLSLGIFAVFAGFMYNDMFSVCLPIFASRFEDKNHDGHYTPMYDVTNSGGPGPYPFGLDWAWGGASNELLYVNSMKMKLSVLFGVLQMIVGLMFRWSNALYDKNMTDFIFECVPMMVFMLCFFGWMDVMILYKWTHPIDNAPNIINSLICMAMGQKDLNPLWPGSVQLASQLMKYTVLSVPFLLFPKPFILLWQHNKAQAQKTKDGHHMLVDEEQGAHSAGGHGHGDEFEFGEVFIHQIIETIEYVLGTVSHTASYLRIWALSLAHQQLSEVFFQKTLTMGLEMPFPANGIMLYLMFAAWFGVTLGVLLGMDVLECFLHTLRLHWVEFQSKFYKAGGEKFAPYNVKALIATSSAE
uniref:V-type proton ATPase subunit a n=1 Tax=Zooxanthella nutricula TaxID=1333877 RepID=A0A7S2K1C8_9DINO